MRAVLSPAKEGAKTARNSAWPQVARALRLGAAALYKWREFWVKF